MQKSSRASLRSPLRANGIGTLAVLVLLGVGVTAGYMQWKAPEVRAIINGRKREVAGVPSAPEERLVHWLKYGNALIHNRLQEMRFSAAQPWLVTYAIAGKSSETQGSAARSSVPDDGRPPSTDSRTPGSGAEALEIYGVDLRDMPRELGRIQGLTVVVRLPRARSLGCGQLTGDHAPFVPIVPASQPLPDADKRSRDLAAWALQGLGQALERDIPGAHLSIEVGPGASWSEIAEVRSQEAAQAPAQPSDRR